MALIIVGCIALIGAGLLMWGWSSNKAKIAQLRAAKRRTAKELQELAAEVAKEIGPGSYNELVEVRGVAECQNPITSQLSNTNCVYYRMKVDREHEEMVNEYNQQTKQTVRRMRRQTTTLASNTQSCPFTIRDETGVIQVMPDGADIDAQKTLSRFEPENNMMGAGGGHLSYGGFSFALGGGMGGMGMGMGGSRTIGYRLEEYTLPVGRSLYVMGEASDAEGQLTVHKPSKRSNKFIISPKSKEALIQATWKKSIIFMGFAIASSLLGIGLIIGGIVAG